MVPQQLPLATEGAIMLRARYTNVQQTVTFARRETFHPRFSWLKKGFDRASVDSEIFLREDAPVRLGVGKNMVRSIWYWCSAFKLLQDDQLTEFGQQLLGADGWDPYLEDPASLWLLHWKLFEYPCQATAWNFAFNDFRQVKFTAEDLFYQLCEYRDRVAPRISDERLLYSIPWKVAIASAAPNLSDAMLPCLRSKNKLIEGVIYMGSPLRSCPATCPLC